VFTLADGQAEIRADVRIDGMTSPNAHERAVLNAVGLEYQESIREAAAGCPIEIIRCSSS
jgi:ferredoxin